MSEICQICGCEEGLINHHTHYGWCDGGKTIKLCYSCHRKVHYAKEYDVLFYQFRVVQGSRKEMIEKRKEQRRMNIEWKWGSNWIK
jgi:hypothetical protein